MKGSWKQRRPYSVLKIKEGIMRNYRELVKQLRDAKGAKSLITEIKKFENDGDFICGRIVDMKPFEHSQGDKPCMQYIMESIEGKKSFVLGARLDAELEGYDLADRIIYVEFKGQLKLENGRRVNLFNIEDITDINVDEVEDASLMGGKKNVNKETSENEAAKCSEAE